MLSLNGKIGYFIAKEIFVGIFYIGLWGNVYFGVFTNLTAGIAQLQFCHIMAKAHRLMIGILCGMCNLVKHGYIFPDLNNCCWVCACLK